MFRVKLRIAPDLLQKFESQVKTGVRGVGFVPHPQRPAVAGLTRDKAATVTTEFATEFAA